MCGITGILQLDGNRVNPNAVQNMTFALKHRGPNGSGEYFDPSGRYGAGHRRLSIIDLSDAGKQPYTSDDGRFVLCYNGEIFNFIEIRQELQQFGVQFRSKTDTEVVLASFIHWGPECLLRFNGMWAFTIWDNENKELFVARDRFGIKPLYYTFKQNHHFVYASETVAFQYAPHDGARNLSSNHIHKAIQSPFSLEGNGLTIFENIKSILPGHYAIVKEGANFQQTRWWNTLLEQDGSTDLSYDDQVARFRELSFDATKIRLRSDVDIATALSGGLDSSSVFGIIQNIALDEKSGLSYPESFHHAFIASFPNTPQDETNFALDVTTKYDAPHTVFEQDFAKLAGNIVSSTRSFDAIYSTPLIVANDIYRNMKENGFSVSMDGHGVDEYMYGYQGLQKLAATEALEIGNVSAAQDYLDIFNQMSLDQSINDLGQLVSSKQNSVENNIIKRAQAAWNFRIRRKYWVSPFSEPIQQRKFDELDLYALKSERELYLQFHQSMLPTILRNFDMASMAHGVESRAPFLDHRIVTMMFHLPISSKMGGGYTKRLLRDSMLGILPESIRTRKLKTGLNAPLRDWFFGALNEFALDTIHSKSFQNSAFFNGKFICKEIKKPLRNKMESNPVNWTRFWTIMNTHIVTANEL